MVEVQDSRVNNNLIIILDNLANYLDVQKAE